MSPKTAKTPAKAAAPGPAHPPAGNAQDAVIDDNVNWGSGYLAGVKEDMRVISDKYQTIIIADALSKNKSVNGAFSVSCHTNVFRHGIFNNQLSFVRRLKILCWYKSSGADGST